MPYIPERAYELVAKAHEHGRLAHALLISGPNPQDLEQLVIKIAWMLRSREADAGMNLFGEPEVVATPERIDELESELVQVLRPLKKSRLITIDAIREVEERLHYGSGPTQWKVVILWDAHRMNVNAQNAFLKTLEEPPPRCLILLVSGQPQLLLPTIHSRCLSLQLLGRMDFHSNGGTAFMQSMEAVATKHFGTAVGAMLMRSLFEHVIEERFKEIIAIEGKISAEETKAYHNTTDGEWLSERDAVHEATAESLRVAEQARFIDLMLCWLADVLRVANGVAPEDFPECHATMRLIAEKEGSARMVRRIDALEDMRQTLLGTNAMAALALDVGFLRVFGANLVPVAHLAR